MNRPSFALCCLILVSVEASSKEAIGMMENYGCDSTQRYRLTLMHIPGADPTETIGLILPSDWALGHLFKDWAPVEGTVECNKRDECTAAATNKIRVRRLSSHSISGDFAVEFRGGRKLEGSFTAKWVKPKEPWICE